MCSESAPRLSIGIPCYGTADYIGRCLTSLVPLAGHGVEVILVDDCSPDDMSGAISRALQGDASAIAPYTQVLRNEVNQGLPATRGIQFKEARGNYLLFVDSDDFVDAEAILKALDFAEQQDADVVATPFNFVSKTGISVKRVPDNYNLNKLPIHVTAFSLCNKLIRRRMFIEHQIDFWPGINRWEDLGVTARIFALQPRIVTLSRGWYYYTVDESRPTLSSFAREKTIAERSAIARRLENWFAERGLREKYAEFLTALKFYAKGGYLRSPRDLKSWRETFPEARATLTKPSALPFVYRIAFMLLNI